MQSQIDGGAECPFKYLTLKYLYTITLTVSNISQLKISNTIYKRLPKLNTEN